MISKPVIAPALLLFCTLACESLPAQNLADVLSSITEDGQPIEYLQVGLSVSWLERPLHGDNTFIVFPVIETRVSWQGVFAEASSDSIGIPGLAIGYELVDTDEWALDALIVSVAGNISPAKINRLSTSNIKKREAMTLIGIRATRFFSNFVVQGHVLPVGKGAVASLAAGHLWQVKNWNFSVVGVVRYDDKTLNDAVWGISADEATAAFPEYSPDGDFMFSARFSAEYPLSEHWVVELSAFHLAGGNAIAESPIVTQKASSGVGFEINYVF